MISVLLPFRDADATIGEAIASALADLGPTDELVAIDDGSADASARLVAGLAARDGRVVLLEAPEPGQSSGIVAALSRGLDAARFDLLARMDADDVTLGGRFAAQRALLESDPALGAVGVQVELFPEPRGGMAAYVAWQNALVTAADHAAGIFVESPLCHPATMIRRAALEAVGGYRDPGWAEDYDLWLRLDAAGYGLAKVPRVLFRWRIRPDSLTWTDPRYAPERLRAARASFLAARLARAARPFAIWGAGQTGRRLARELERSGARASFFLDIDPRKIGRTARGAPVLSPGDGVTRARRDGALLVVAVGARGARDLVRGRLGGEGLVEGVDFLCAA